MLHVVISSKGKKSCPLKNISPKKEKIAFDFANLVPEKSANPNIMMQWLATQLKSFR